MNGWDGWLFVQPSLSSLHRNRVRLALLLTQPAEAGQANTRQALVGGITHPVQLQGALQVHSATEGTGCAHVLWTYLLHMPSMCVCLSLSLNLWAYEYAPMM